MSLSAEHLTLRYDDRVVVDGLSVRIPTGRITAIVGPNACGKSTLLRGLGRLIAPADGRVLLDETDVRELPARELARRLGMLPQSPVAPEGITVADLVERGRSPHQSWFGGRTAADDEAVGRAMTATGVLELAGRSVDELSGGQRQRVWIAMVLAQDTPTLLLDEPTTYLDMAHAVEVLDLLVDRNTREGTTVAVVLHDLDLAARYADHLIAMRAGAVVAEGTPAEVVTESTVETVFGIPARVVPDPVSGTPLVVPIGRHRVAPDPAAPEPAIDTLIDAGDALPADDTGCPPDVGTEAALRAVVGDPHPLVVAKVGDRVDPTAAEFVAAASLVVLASGRADGGMDVSPRGDPAGFVRVLDDGARLALPERPGNRRIDTLRNVVERPGMGLLFLVPGITHVLRVAGRGRVVDDPAVLGLWEDPPPLALVVDVVDCFVHCSRALTHSTVWTGATPASTVPGVKALADAAREAREAREG
ncbi:ATP-binding cassette domain-containing protein [Actinomycetospora sp. OC33-EN08]|uniref:ATP-binding cassette domain-containing protein n=1 Tax=Actinomycetospora aurantiaca TaxID=3129233 RepID=A0ABU8MLD7_9PSEU